jgi:hypothetical protein
VAKPLLQRRRPALPPFLLFELPREEGVEQAVAGVAEKS